MRAKTNSSAQLRTAVSIALCVLSMASIEATRSLRAETLQELLTREWQYELREDPQLATDVGDRRYNGIWQDYSISARQKQTRGLSEWLRLFDQVDPKT